ncbi:soluble guanylate cyclase 88E-like, partial [Tropilaelaps mercedesae]
PPSRRVHHEETFITDVEELRRAASTVDVGDGNAVVFGADPQESQTMSTTKRQSVTGTAHYDIPTSTNDLSTVQGKWSNFSTSMMYAGAVRCEHCLHCHARAMYERKGLEEETEIKALRPVRLGQQRTKTCALL